MYKEIKYCRVSKKKDLITFLNLGNQKLTGVFPKPNENLESGPLELVWSPSSYLVQLKHTFDANEMYGNNYGYRSGLNNSMVQHLINKVNYLIELSNLSPGDVVVDIGSNDCTTLKAFPNYVKRIGIDPTIKKFLNYYPSEILQVADFFSEKNYRSVEKNKNAKLVLSIACFYDLDDPISFVRDIHSILDENGLWHFEQAYLPSTLRSLSYDTACHEHIEYYSMLSVQNILKQAGMKIVDVSLNDINGGSFAVTACKDSNTSIKINDQIINWMIGEEYKMDLHNVKPYFNFARRTYEHKDSLVNLVRSLRADGKTIYGYGASTKGNVLLQWCGFTSDDIIAIGEVNSDKFGCVTPGTNIPIVSESEIMDNKPDYLIVLPWHFRQGIIQREKNYINSGGKFIFPFPYIQVI